MTHLDPACALAHLIYIGYGASSTSAMRLTRRKSIDIKKRQTNRTCIHCLVFGSKSSGKSAILDSFVGRLVFSKHYFSSITGFTY